MKLPSQVSTRGLMVVVPQSLSFSSARPIPAPRATTHPARAAVSATSQESSSETPAPLISSRYAWSAGPAAGAGSEAKHQQLGNGASR